MRVIAVHGAIRSAGIWSWLPEHNSEIPSPEWSPVRTLIYRVCEPDIASAIEARGLAPAMRNVTMRARSSGVPRVLRAQRSRDE